MKIFDGKYLNSKNSHLIISVLIILPVALAYGIFPASVLPKLFDFDVSSTDLKSVFRSVMCLYLGMSAIWTVGILKPKFHHTATVTNVVFMGSLAFGRIVSWIVDGIPSHAFLYGLAAETALFFLGFMQLKAANSKANPK